VFVTFAVIGAMPRANSVGKVINVPPPASALIAPAATAAAPTRTKSNPLNICPLAYYETPVDVKSGTSLILLDGRLHIFLSLLSF
jgi:Tfp pilus assembly protein FimV